jgi:hypothetical protein
MGNVLFLCQCINFPSKNPCTCFRIWDSHCGVLHFNPDDRGDTFETSMGFTELDSITAHKITLFRLTCYCLFLSDSEATLEHSSFWEFYSRSAGQELKGPLPCLEDPVFWPYYEPDKSIRTLISCLFESFLKTLPSTSRFFKWSFRFRSFQVGSYRSHEYGDIYALYPVLEQ